jgi:UDP-GlcNAc3NAcA epimerase
MIKILTIVGTRPQIIKSFSLSKEIRSNFSNLINEIIVHTGQHYDEKMSEIFYKEINLALPKYEFKLDPNHKISTLFQIIFNLEEIVKKEKPNAILVYGDTNSTFAGAYIASKLNIKLLHVEAGLRSYDKNMPEELNRIFTDHLSSILFCPTKSSVKKFRN